MLDEDNPTGSTPEDAQADAPPRTRRRAAGRPAGPPASTDIFSAPVSVPAKRVEEPADDVATAEAPKKRVARKKAQTPPATGLTFQAPETQVQAPRKQAEPADDGEDAPNKPAAKKSAAKKAAQKPARKPAQKTAAEEPKDADDDQETTEVDEFDEDADGDEAGDGTRRRRRRRGGRRRSGGSDADSDDDSDDGVTSVAGSTRLEAKKQRRREGREAGRRRAPILTEAEFLARRESVERQMVVRDHKDSDGKTVSQIAVLEDGVLVEHYVARESQTSLIGNVYMGKVQNVLPSMEAAFIDIGQGRNAVLYAGEVDWSTLANGKQRKIEDALKPGQAVLVQVTKDPVGQKGARLTSQVSLPGRFLVLVPGGSASGISRKLPDAERARLKTLLKDVLPEDAGFIVRTAAEGASEEQLQRDVRGLTARWEDIERKVKAGKAPEQLYAEPDLRIKVVRDLFNEDFGTLLVEGPDAWDDLSGYVQHVAPDLAERLQKWEPAEDAPNGDSFSTFRIDEQIEKALQRTVHLPSGGSLVIDRTEAMTVVDVNTGKFTGSGGNLEETVTKNNLEAAEEIVRQLRLRDIGGIIVIDFIDMVLESNRDLVMRRLVECLGRDRTRHQVAEVTSLGLVQMTRKRIGTGLLESFSHKCEHCNGRGVVVEAEPVEPRTEPRQRPSTRSRRGGRSRGGNKSESGDAPTTDAVLGDAADESVSDAGQDQVEAVLTDTPEAP